ncbi:hypothetical protein ACOMHN_054856 [Nucella lapillus]
MCDHCAETFCLLQNYETRGRMENGRHLSKDEIMMVVHYFLAWPEKQCFCCYTKDQKNMERMNIIIQIILRSALQIIKILPALYAKKHKQEFGKVQEVAGCSTDKSTEKSEGDQPTAGASSGKDVAAVSEESETREPDEDAAMDLDGVELEEESFTMDEKQRLLDFTQRVFITSFPLYQIQKSIQPISLETLFFNPGAMQRLAEEDFMPFETSTISLYCDMTKIEKMSMNYNKQVSSVSTFFLNEEPSAFFLRNICFLCDTNLMQNVTECFSSPDIHHLPVHMSHALIQFISNVRYWLNPETIIQHIMPLRIPVIRYLCSLQQSDLRSFANRGLTDSILSAVKETPDRPAGRTFDGEGLALAYKFFNCESLSLRMAGIVQINNQIALYNEAIACGDIEEAPRFGSKLADWLVEKELVVKIFGPNIHMEIVKNSQMILTFLAMEYRLSDRDLDSIWSSCQLKHCSKQVYDVLTNLLKNLDHKACKHVRDLISRLDPTEHNESTVVIASTLDKLKWHSGMSQHHLHTAAIQQQLHPHVGPFATLRGEPSTSKGLGKPLKRDHDLSTSGSEREEEEDTRIRSNRPNGSKKRRRSLPGKCVDRTVEMESSGEEEEEVEDPCCRMHHALGAHAHHSADLHEDSLGSDSSLGAQSDLSEDSIQDERILEAAKMAEESNYRKHLQQHRHIHPNQGVMETDDCTETSEDEVEEEEDDEEDEEEAAFVKEQHGEIRTKKESLTMLKREAVKLISPKKVGKDHHGRKKEGLSAGGEGSEPSKKLNESSEMEAFEQEHTDVVDVPFSEDEDVLKEAKMVRLKNFPRESGSSADEMGIRDLEDQEHDSSPIHLGDHHHLKRQVDLQTDKIRGHPQVDPDDSNYPENIMSPESGGSASPGSQMSDKGSHVLVKGFSDDELEQIHAQAQYPGPHVGPHMPLGNFYHHVPKSMMTHRGMVPRDRQVVVSSFTYDDVCKKGNTLIWDLVQDDVAAKLPEGLVVDAEKALHTLISYGVDPCIRAKFIEACVQNLADHKTIIISLRLLPKLFGSFQSYSRGNSEIHSITIWAETELGLMHHFFEDLVHFTQTWNTGDSNALHSYKEEVQVRLSFLTMIYANTNSPDTFRMNEKQVDILWSCLVENPASADDCLQWFFNQAKSKEHHGLGLELFRHMFLQKMPRLNPENMTMIGLNLFQHLSHLTRISITPQRPLSEDQICGMDQLWEIILQARNQEVSMSATQYLNGYFLNYGGGQLDREEFFIERCVEYLMTALASLKTGPAVYVQRIHRGLILLKNHLELFSRRYAFHLRTLRLDGVGMTPHQAPSPGKCSIRLLLQPTGITEKTQIDMQVTDLVSELRAEVTRWWEILQRQQQQQRQQLSELTAGHSGLASPILGAMLGDGPIRMIFLGQELTVDVDDKTLAEMQLKDNLLVFVSVGASRTPKKQDGTVPSSCLPAPDRAKMPLALLTQEPHFGNLFTLLEKLSNAGSEMENSDAQERARLQAEARRLSRVVWELLMILPTSPSHLQGFTQQSGEPGSGDAGSKVDWDSLLPPDSPHRLYYSLQILEQLAYGKPPSRKTIMTVGAGDMLSFTSEGTSASNQWKTRFMSKGGVAHLLNIVMSGTLQPQEGDSWSQWNQECLAYLLRIITQFSAEHQDKDAMFEDTEAQDSPRKKIRRLRDEKVVIPRLTQSTMDLLNVEELLKIVMKILYETAYPADLNQLYMCSWGRAEVVSTALSLLVSVAYSSQEVHELQSATPDFTAWLKRLTLVAPEPYVRKEAAMGLYRLCLGHTADSDQGQTGRHYLLPILSTMLTFLSDAIQFKPERHNEIAGKEPFGPGCRDYFWLLCRLVEGYSKWQTNEQCHQSAAIDLDDIASRCANLILTRPYYETRHGGEEDDGLCGMLGLLTSIVKNNLPLKESPMGKALVKDLFSCCFALPSTSERHLPRCKSSLSHSCCYDLMIELCKGCSDNYTILQQLLLAQHTKDSHLPYPFEYWPQDNGRSKAGFCGIQNLGATCYMAAALQFIFMIPEMREAILQAKVSECVRHHDILKELQKMFAFLQESERKAYNPRSFCKMYNMGNQPLNTGEQKDMQEFFTDLLTKMEEMTPTLKVKIKEMFRGVITNSVVSLDCPHVSRTFEEFSTIRCQVSDMKDLYASLDLVTVKDCLEGDNKYECGKCEGKVNVCAEKRACFRKLPEVLCINTMRYSFNFNTMMKEKLNSHFSFPRAIDMSSYMEHKLLGPDKMKDCDEPDAYGVRHPRDSEDDSFDYRLSGVTVHTGTADGGHYYTFIRGDLEKEDLGEPESWLLCNDAEVKPFDASQIGVECFGGEMTSKTYDSVSDKFLDLSYEKTNSAYMLLYTRVRKNREPRKYSFELCPELAAHIWEDNMQYLKDKNIFEHSYFNFIWQVCGYLPNTMPRPLNDTTAVPNDVLLKATQLTASFVLETLIHSKEKPTMLQWIETLTKHFNKCHDACEWFLDHMASDDWWVSQIFIKCPTTMVRQLFHRLLFHVINELRPEHTQFYLETAPGEDVSEMGNRSCVTRFVKKVLAILDTNVRQYSKHLSEYLHFLQDFAKMGEEECSFLLRINCIYTLVTFYMGHKQDNPGLSTTQTSYVEILSEDEEEEEVLTMPDDTKPSPMEKMIGLIALLLEKSRGRDKVLQISNKDYTAIVGSGTKVFAFLLSQIREQIQLRQTCNIICSVTRWNENLAISIVSSLFNAVKKLGPEHAQPFLKLMTFLVEINSTGPVPGCANFTQIILPKMWDLAKVAPVSVLEWLTQHVTRNKMTHTWVLEQMELWVEHYLIAHNNVRVRNAAVYLLISLVPCSQFRSSFRTTAGRTAGVNKDLQMTPEALQVVHKIYKHLLGLLSSARVYVDPQVHGTMKLVCYFLVLQACVISKREKLMFGDYFKDLWQLFQPKLLEPQIATHHNKQSLLNFWYLVCVDCPENVEMITTNPHVCRNIAFNYILADHEDQDIMMFNRMMLPSYYGLLRLCCQHSRTFTRQLALHQNIVWAFKNITPYPSQYTHAVDELYKIMRLMSARYADSSEEELQAVGSFRRSTILMYLRDLEARTHWQTLLSAFKILVETHDERMVVLYNNGLTSLSEAFMTLHVMYHEATACHMTSEIMDILTMLSQCLRTVRECMEKKAQSTQEMKGVMMGWKERAEVVKKLLTLLNSYTPTDIRALCFDVLKQMILILQPEMISMLVPFLTQWHTTFQENNGRKFGPHKDSLVHSGPYFPRRGQKLVTNKSNIRPPRPQFQMMLHTGLLESMKGIDETYDQQVYNFFIPYHSLLDTLQRMAINLNSFNNSLINLGAMVALEGVPICSPYFAKLWNEIYDSESADPDHSMVQMLVNSRYFIDYCDTVLMDERSSLNNFHIFKFFKYFFPKVYEQVLGDQATTCIDNLVAAAVSEKSMLKSVHSEEEININFRRIGGDMRAMTLLFSVLPSPQVNPLLVQTLHQILAFCRDYHDKQSRQEQAAAKAAQCVDCVDVDDSEVRSDDEQAASSRLSGADTPKGGGQKVCSEDGGAVPSTASDSKDGTRGKDGENEALEEKDCDGEVELMCVDVTEASESIEVCTTPSAELAQDPEGSGTVKRHSSGDDSDAPACKKRHHSGEEPPPHSPSHPGPKGDSPDPTPTPSSHEGKGPTSQQTHNPERAEASQGSKPGGRSSPQPGTSQQEAGDGVGEPQPGPSGLRSESGGSGEREEGAPASSSSPKGGSSSSKGTAEPKNIVDRVRMDIEELLRVLDRASSSS